MTASTQRPNASLVLLLAVLLAAALGAARAQQPTAEPETYLAEVGSSPAATGGVVRLLHVLPGDMPLTVYVPTPDGQGGDAKRAAVVKAFQQWADAAPDLVSFLVVGQPKQGALEVQWQDLQGNKVGSYRYRFTVQQDGQYRFLPTQVILDPSFTADELHTYAVLQIGHALGLLGRSPYYGDAMSAAPTGTVSPRDVATLRALYDLPSGIVLRRPGERPTGPTVQTYPE